MKTKNLKEKLRNNFYVSENTIINLSNINYILPPTDNKQGSIKFNDETSGLCIGIALYNDLLNYLSDEKY